MGLQWKNKLGVACLFFTSAVCTASGASLGRSVGDQLINDPFRHWLPHPQVLLEAVYFSLVAKRLHPEEDDTLVEFPLVEHVSEKISKVRPPQGFALFQAKEEARKVKLLHRLLKVRTQEHQLALGAVAGVGKGAP